MTFQTPGVSIWLYEITYRNINFFTQKFAIKLFNVSISFPKCSFPKYHLLFLNYYMCTTSWWISSKLGWSDLYKILSFLTRSCLTSREVNNRLAKYPPTKLICPPSKFNLPISQNCPPSNLFAHRKMGTTITKTKQFRPIFFFAKLTNLKWGTPLEPHTSTLRIGNTSVLCFNWSIS